MTDDFDELTERAADDALKNDLQDLFRSASNAHPRSSQQALGPSEVGHPCQRKLAYMMTRHGGGRSGGNQFSDPFPSIAGVALHSWADKAAALANETLGYTRWLAEARVTVREGLSGTCDLYDCDTATVIDWKFPGKTRHDHAVKHGPLPVYQSQVQLYGKGYRNLGFPVNRVGIAFVGRASTLRRMHLWTTPYDESKVNRILGNVDATKALIELHDLPNKPENFALIPITPDEDCRSTCSYWTPNPASTDPYECAGPQEPRNA